MTRRLRMTLLLGLVGGSFFGATGQAVAKRTTVSATTGSPGQAAASPTKPDEDEIVEVATPDSARPSRGTGGAVTVDSSLQARLEQLEQQHIDLNSKLEDMNQRLKILTNPSTAVRLSGYIDFGFFGFVNGNGSGITNYLPQPSPGSASSAYAQRFPEFFAPCGFTPSNQIIPCPRAGTTALNQNQPRWHFLGDPLGTAINSAGHPADTRSQNYSGQTSQAVPYDYIQSGGHPTFIINELNLMPIVKLDALKGLSALASINFYPRTASVSLGDKMDGGSVVSGGPTRVGDYVWVDMAFLEYATRFGDGKHTLNIFAGRFDPNIGIEYRVRKSPDRFGVTPSLICRYSCGTPLGLKIRGQFFDELFSLALAVHNSASYQEIFRFSEDTDKKYMKTVSGRLAFHCNERNHCKKVNLEIGVSGEFGGEVDGFYDVGRSEFNPFVSQWTFDVDLHLEYKGLELRAEFLKSQADGFIGSDVKPSLPKLVAQGAYVEASYRLTNWFGILGRWDFRDASHIDYSVPFAYISTIWRVTAGLRFDINNNVAVKAEFVHLQPFGRMKEGLDDNAGVGINGNPLAGQGTAGDFAADYVTTSLVLRY